MGVRDVLGQLVGRVRARWVDGERGCVGWAVKPSRLGCCEASFFFFFFYFVFLLLCFEFKFGFKI